MAIKVGGTEVVDNNRQLKNIASVDATTVAALGTAGVGGGNSYEATADGNIVNGKPCIIQANGTVKQVGTSVQTNNPATSGGIIQNAVQGNVNGKSDIVAVPNTNHVVRFYTDANDSSKGKFTLGTVDVAADTITWKTPQTFISSSGHEPDAVYDPDIGGFFVVVADVDNTREGRIYLIKINYSDGTATEQPSGIFWNSYASKPRIASEGNGRGVIAIKNDSNNQGYAISFRFTDSNNSFAFSTYNVNASTTLEHDIGYDANANRYVMVYRDNGNSEKGTARCLQMDAAPNYNLGLGSEFRFDQETSDWNRIEYDATAQKLIIAWRQEDSSYNYSLRLCTVSINTGSNDLSFGTHTSVSMSNVQYIELGYSSDAGGMGVVFRDSTNNNYGGFYLATTSGTSITLDTKGSFATTSEAYPYGLTYSPNLEAFVVTYNMSGNLYGRLSIIRKTQTLTNLTTENYLGIADAAYSNSASATIQTMGAIDDAQTSLTAGQKYYVQPDGTLATSAGSPSVEAGLAVSATKLLVKG